MDEALAKQEFIARARVDANEVGHLHNEALRATYQRLHAVRRASPQGVLTKMAIAHTIADSCSDFLGSRNLDTAACEVARSRLVNKARGGLQSVSEGELTPIPLATGTPSDYEDAFEAVVAAEDNSTDWIAGFNAVESEALSVLTDSADVTIIIATVAVGDSSAVYCEGEFDDWYSLGLPDCEAPDPHPACAGPPEGPQRSWGGFLEGLRNSLAADCLGGLAGGLGAKAISMALPGIREAALAAGVAASVYQAGQELMTL
ncbi:MAG: hypothetical protein RLN75_02715 [Longimicrobiales bacterium]